MNAAQLPPQLVRAALSPPLQVVRVTDQVYSLARLPLVEPVVALAVDRKLGHHEPELVQR